VDALLWIVAAVWAGHALAATAALRLVPTLTPAPPSPGHAPRVAAVVAARDEEARIEETARRLLAQASVDLTLVVVDDRSADATPDILARLAAEDPRLVAERVDELPAGWLGKCHACHAGAQRALETDPDWMLFIDADVWLEPTATARAIAEADRADAGHATLIPGFARCQGLGKPAALACVLPFVTRSAMANLRVPGQQVGIGGFNLVRADAYRDLGGHKPLRLEIVDDLFLAVLANRAGARSLIMRATNDVEVEYAASLRGLIALTTKNNFAIFRFRTLLSCAAIIGFLALFGLALAGPFISPVAGTTAIAGLASTALPAALLARTFGWSPLPALLVPLAQLVMPVMLANSMLTTLRQGGVKWRDTLYPLKQLRQHRVR